MIIKVAFYETVQSVIDQYPDWRLRDWNSKVRKDRGKSSITDPLSYLSNYKRYQKIIYTRTVSNLMINMNTYFVFKNM